MLQIKNVNYKDILEDINLSFTSQKIITIIGENGAGKSTLAKCIAGLNEYSGDITFNNKNDFVVGYVFQNPENQFIRNTVIDDLAFSLESLNFSKAEMEKKIQKIAIDFEMEELLYKNISSLSGGQKQKVAIVANLILEPDILILDEAFEMIDEQSTAKIKALLQSYISTNEVVCIHISHDINVVDMADHIVVLQDKKIVFNDDIETFYKNQLLLEKLNLELPLYRKIIQRLGLNITTNKEMEEILCKLNLKV